MVSPSPRPFAVLLAVGSAIAQAGSPPQDPALSDRLKELKSLVSDHKMRRDFQAIGLIQLLVEHPDKLHPKDRKKIAKALGDVFRIGKVRQAGQDHLYREAGDALAVLGEDGGKYLLRTLENKRIADHLRLRAELIEDLGRTRDEDAIDWLLEQATRSPHDILRGAAGTALGEFTGAKAKVQREIVKKLIREWGSLHGEATQAVNLDPNAPVNFGPQNARRTLRVIEPRWRNTLTRLTGQRLTRFPDWQRWLNKNPRWNPPGARKKT